MDERLATNATLENISVSINMLDMIWSPDTIFYNGRKSHLHVVPQPNRFIRIVAYSESDVIYKWRYGDSESVELAPNMQMSQFDLINFSASHSTILRKSTYHSMLSVRFDLKRHTGYFLINIFIPCMLLVILSWVSFWINREATSDRIALGTTTVLTMTFLALDSRSDLPRVSYATALDLYIAMCFLFVLATILEFAVVHHFTKIRHGDAIHIPVPVPAEYIRQRRLQRLKQLNNGTSEAPTNNRTFLTRSASSRLRVWCSSLKYKITSSRRRKEPEVNSVSMLDKACRILFPTVFAILNLAYWIMYSA
ncbi:hypothetical protein KUTeg_024160 [Tegillarca granosa]|uniref:Neurotransmitter-gated ion-channel transmembrane domain-containing protein n=1 Tax=Tegillarca granosa TaxID=220873 RepID=A0ABQ9E0P1_TEGGR|nr:hypothetical protein KUTeg_024160 [Tegillarca granosa]